MTVVVAQLGARMHYAVPRILSSAGQLERLHTDIYSGRKLVGLIDWLPPELAPPGLRRLRGRVPRNLASEEISAFNLLGISYAVALRLFRSRNAQHRTHLLANSMFASKVAKLGFGNARAVYAFNGAALELLKKAKQDGVKGILEQTMAPLMLNEQLLQEEARAHPGWEQAGPVPEYCTKLAEREEEEWQYADAIFCGSEFVRDGIAARGGPINKCVVVPYGVDIRNFGSLSRVKAPGAPLRVLTVGAVGLRKGAPYLLETAKRLKGLAEFRLVGPLGIATQKEEELRRHLDVVGSVPRTEVLDHLRWADVFFLPSLLEGSATVTYEALAAGVPVVCTPNTGSLVSNGTNGYVVPTRDIDGFTNVLRNLAEDSDLLRELTEGARSCAESISETAYRERFLRALHQVVSA